MINFLAAYIPNLSSVKAPLQSLLKSVVLFEWEPEQQAAMRRVKEILSPAPVLYYFDSSAVSTIQADVSQSGLGACLP